MEALLQEWRIWVLITADEVRCHWERQVAVWTGRPVVSLVKSPGFFKWGIIAKILQEYCTFSGVWSPALRASLVPF